METADGHSAGAQSPRKKRRPRRRSLGREEFLAKALEVFIEMGFEGASIDAITAKAGIAKKTIYDRYGDKESLFKAAVEQGIDEWIVPVERLRAAEKDDLEESLLAIGGLLVQNILTPAGLRLLRLTNAVSGRMPEIGVHNVRYGEDPTIDYLADLFRRKLGGGGAELPCVEDAAEIFLHLVVGGPAIAAAWGIEKAPEAIARRTRLSVKIFLQGLISVLVEPARAAPAAADLKALADALDLAADRLDFARGLLRAKRP